MGVRDTHVRVKFDRDSLWLFGIKETAQPVNKEKYPVVDIPKALYFRYLRAQAEYDRVQEALKEIYQEHKA